MGNEGSTKMVQTIRRIAEERDIKLVLIEHDLEMVMQISDRITVLNRGAILKEGDPETIQRLVEDAPTISHGEFVKIADATARFPNVDIDLSTVTAPTLILHGEHLPMVNETTTQRLVDQLSNTDPAVQVVPGSGHASNIDNPEFFTAALREFLLKNVRSNRMKEMDNSERIE
jgi:pimeloyl-ACP methyl ester carboxylesterase